VTLKEMDQKFNLADKLQQQCQSKTWKPRVHAELLLLDLFWTQNFEFVDGDRYIGSSKAACYCCYHYIHAHPGRFVVPACHNNNWLNWRAPDIYNPGRPDLIRTREDILNDMAKQIRLDVLGQLDERRGPAKRKADSLTEISSVWVDKLCIERLKPITGSEDSISRQELDDVTDAGVGSSDKLDSSNEDPGVASSDSTNSEEGQKQLEVPDYALEWRGKVEEVSNHVDDDDEDEDDSEGGVAL